MMADTHNTPPPLPPLEHCDWPQRSLHQGSIRCSGQSGDHQLRHIWDSGAVDTVGLDLETILSALGVSFILV